MPDWTAPFEGPKLSSAEFKKKQEDYADEYGYRYSIPGFDDIIHLDFEKPMSAEEERWWKQKKYSEFTPERYDEIKYMKWKRREKYLDMLGSPVPDILNTRASLMTAIDNAQDAMSVVAAIGIITANWLPRQISKVITGPLGWMMATADILNLAMEFLTPEQRLIARKRLNEELTENNPYSKKARLKKIERLQKHGLGLGKILEALQVTKDVFGQGISLGPLMGLPVSIISGAARWALGKPVYVRYPIPNIPIWKRRILRAFNSDPIVMGVKGLLSTLDKHKYLITGNLRAQNAKVHGSVWNPIEKLDNVGNIEVMAPVPWNILTLEVIQEIDAAGIDKIGWPSTGEKWSTVDDISMSTHRSISSRFDRYCKNNRRNWEGFVGASNGCMSAMYNLDYIGGPGNVEYDYIAAEKSSYGMYTMGYRMPQNLSHSQMSRFISYMEDHEARGTCPSTYDAMNFAKNICGFTFEKGQLPRADASDFMLSIT